MQSVKQAIARLHIGLKVTSVQAIGEERSIHFWEENMQTRYGLFIILISPYLLTLSIWIQITIHPHQ